VGVLAGVLISAGAAFAASAPAPSAPAGFAITKLAAPAPASASNCDDLAFLEGHLFMGCQNKTLSVGGGGYSTLIEYTTAGAVVNTWSIKDKIDGTPFVQHLNTTKGLVYVDATGSTTPLTLNGSPVSTTTSSSGGSSNTGLIVAIIVVALVLLAGGAYWLRGRAAS